MLKKLKIIMIFASISVSLCLMSNTYSRYVSDTEGNVDVLLANWQILVNNSDISNNSNSSISFTPIIEQNENVKSNVVAPSSKGYFDIEIDPTNVDVSFNYSIDLSIDNNVVPDLMITKYVIIPNDYVEEQPLEPITLNSNTITNSLYVDVDEDNDFQKFTVRVYFEWYEGENENMDNTADTAIGNEAANNMTFTINANISFSQILS